MADPNISAQFLRHVANCLELTGRSAEPLLARIGVTREALNDPDGLIRLADFVAFFEDAAEYASNPYFGLHVGRLAGSDSLGPLSFLFLSAPSLREAFTSFTRYLGTMQEASRNDFRADARWAMFEYAVMDPGMTRRRQDAEYSIGVMFSLARQFLAGDFELEEVHFEHAMTGEYARYREYFGCDVLFEQDRNAFIFPARYLDLPGRALSSALHPILEDHLRRISLDHAIDDTLGGRVRRLIESYSLDATPGMAEVAELLVMSVPTLNRRLRAEGTSWRQIVAEHRMRGAARLLRESRREIAQIALAAGFAESASFIRSFRRHFGTTPSRYRRGDNAGSAGEGTT